MVLILNGIIAIAGCLLLLGIANVIVFTILIAISELRSLRADTDTKRGDQGISRGAVANSMGKP